MDNKCYINLGISMAATGSNVLYYEYMLQPYDYAAALCIIEMAGGIICQTNGEAVTLDKGCSVVAGTRKAVEEFMLTAKNRQ